MEVTIKIEGMDQLTEAIAMLGGAMAYFKGASADKAVKAVTDVTAKMNDRIAKAEERSEKREENIAKEGAAPAYTLEALQAAAVELARSGKRDDLAAALAECGAETLPKLAEDQFNVFAEKLKVLGAKL